MRKSKYNPNNASALDYVTLLRPIKSLTMCTLTSWFYFKYQNVQFRGKLINDGSSSQTLWTAVRQACVRVWIVALCEDAPLSLRSYHRGTSTAGWASSTGWEVSGVRKTPVSSEQWFSPRGGASLGWQDLTLSLLLSPGWFPAKFVEILDERSKEVCVCTGLRSPGAN